MKCIDQFCLSQPSHGVDFLAAVYNSLQLAPIFIRGDDSHSSHLLHQFSLRILFLPLIAPRRNVLVVELPSVRFDKTCHESADS